MSGASQRPPGSGPGRTGVTGEEAASRSSSSEGNANQARSSSGDGGSPSSVTSCCGSEAEVRPGGMRRFSNQLHDHRRADGWRATPCRRSTSDNIATSQTDRADGGVRSPPPPPSPAGRKDVECSYCCACPGGCIDPGCGLAPCRPRAGPKKVSDRTSSACVEPPPPANLERPGPQCQLHQIGAHPAPAARPAVRPLDCARPRKDPSRLSLGAAGERGSAAYVAGAHAVGQQATVVNLSGRTVRVNEQDTQTAPVGRPARIVALAVDDCGQSGARAVVVGRQTSETRDESGPSRPEADEQSPWAALVARIKLSAANFAALINKEQRETDQGGRPDCLNSPAAERGNLTTVAPQQQPRGASADGSAPGLPEGDRSAIDGAAAPRPPSSHSSRGIPCKSQAAPAPLKVVNVSAGGRYEAEFSNKGRPGHAFGPGHYRQSPRLSSLANNGPSSPRTKPNHAANPRLSTGANGSAADDCRLEAARTTSIPLPIGNINARQQLEPAAGPNKMPSEQQIRQKNFGLARSNERRSTHCSSPLTTTDLHFNSSDSSGALNCAETMSANLQHQALMRSCERHGDEPDYRRYDKITGPPKSGHEGPFASFSSSASTEQARAPLAGKSGDPCRITFTPNDRKSSGPLKSAGSLKHAYKPVKKREFWDKNIEFLLAVIGFAVDLGNVWRFPYICYKNGGGAFLIPYTIMFILGGLPIFYLELSLGQYFSSGCLTVWRRVCPVAKGIGYAMCMLNFFTGLYYNTVISWAVFFFVESFTLGSLPWTSCNNAWNSANCRTIEQRREMLVRNETLGPSLVGGQNETSQNYSSPTRDYYEREVLQIHLSKGIDDLGSMRTPLAIYLAIVFVCIYFAIWKGVKSTGKAVWITALLPYFVLIPLLVRGLLLEGAMEGIKYFLSPNWSMLANAEVWIDAAKQIYFSLGPGFGTLMALSSYNRFNHNCGRDALVAAAVNYFASFIAGLVIFAVLGYMAFIGKVGIDKVATEGPGLVFQVYPEGLATMRFSAVWSVLFFMMVISLGIDSTFGGLESVITGLCDEYPRVLRANRGIFIGLLIVVIYLCSLPTTTYGGSYVIGLLESYGTSVSLLFIVTVETIIVCWVYGADRFCNNLKEMYGEMPGAYWRICWKYISPTILILIFTAACLQELDKYRALVIENYAYPSWAPTVGLLMTCSSVCCVPIYAIYYLKIRVSGSFYERLKTAVTPEETTDADAKVHNITNLDTDI